MSFKTSDIIEGTFLVILVGMIITKADGFSKAIGALGGVYVNAVRALKA